MAKKQRIYIVTLSLFMVYTTPPLMAAQQMAKGNVLAPSEMLKNIPVTPFSGEIRPAIVGQALKAPALSVQPRAVSVAYQGQAEKIQWQHIKHHFSVAKKNNNEEALISIKHFVTPYFSQLLRKVAARESENIISIFEGLSGIPSVRDVLTEGVIDFFQIHTTSTTNQQKRLQFSGMIANMRVKLSQATALLTTDRVFTSERAYKFFALLDNLAHNVTQSIPEKVYARLGAKGLMALTALLVGGGLAYWKGNEAYMHVKDKVIDPAGVLLNRLTEPPEIIAAKAVNRIVDEQFGGSGKLQKLMSDSVEKIGKRDPDALQKDVEVLENMIKAREAKITTLSAKKHDKSEKEAIKKEIKSKEEEIKALRSRLLKILGNTQGELMAQAAVDQAIKNPSAAARIAGAAASGLKGVSIFGSSKK